MDEPPEAIVLRPVRDDELIWYCSMIRLSGKIVGRKFAVNPTVTVPGCKVT